jgi:hypothetical protein
MGLHMFVVAAFIAGLIGCGRHEPPIPEADSREKIRQVMSGKVEDVTGKSLNSTSPETVSTLTPRLRVGMKYDQLQEILAKKSGVDPKTGKHIGTIVFGRGIVWLKDDKGEELRDEKGEPRPDPNKWYCILYVQDANLKVIFDKDDRLLSWSVEPASAR